MRTEQFEEVINNRIETCKSVHEIFKGRTIIKLKITEILSYVSDTTMASDSSDTDDFLVL